MTDLFDVEVKQLRALYGETAANLPAELARRLYSEWCIPERFAAHFAEEAFARTPEAVRLAQLFCAYIQVVPAEKYLSFDFMNEHLDYVGLASTNMGSGHPLIEMAYSSNSGSDHLQTYANSSELVVQAATYLKSVLARVTPKYPSTAQQNEARGYIATLGWIMQGAFWCLMRDTVVFPEDLLDHEEKAWNAGRECTKTLITSLQRELAPYEAAARKPE